MADKDGFKHVKNSGVSEADLKRGFSNGMAPESDPDGIGFGGYLGEPITEQPIEGFLGRAKGWER